MRGSPIPIPPPGSDERRKMAVSFIQGDRVVAIPRVEHGLFGEAWNGSSLVEGGWAVVGFPGGVPVQWLKVDGPPERPVHITMRWHQVTGVPRGTSSSMPSLTSLSRPAFTSSCQ